MMDLSKIPWSTLGRREAYSELTSKTLAERERVKQLPSHPIFSIVTNGWGEALYESLKAQSYPFWELWVAGPPADRDDARVHFVEESPAGDGEVFQRTLAALHGEWIGFLSSTDVLSPGALFAFALEIDRRGVCDLVYSHEIHLTPDYKTIQRCWSKSEFNWFNSIHFNSIGRAWFARRSSIAGLPFDTRDFEQDLFLRLSEESGHFALLPSYLCYRTGQNGDSLLGDQTDRFETIQSHLKRKNISTRVEILNRGLAVTPNGQPLDGKTLVSVLVCFKNRSDWTSRCLSALSDARCETPMEIVLIDNGSDRNEREKVAESALKLKSPVRWVDDPRPFNFGQMHNDAISTTARGDLLFFLNNDVFLDPDFSFDPLVRWALFDGVGTVGIRLKYPDGRVQHSGFRALYGGFSRMARVGHGHSSDEFARLRREVFGNTFAACMIRRSVFESVGGFRANEFPNGFGDVAMNLELHRRGFHNIYLGDLGGTHLESASRGLSYEYWEEVQLEREYSDVLQKMLRSDQGYDLLPQPDYSVGQLKEIVLGMVYRKFPLALKARPIVKRWLSRAQNRADQAPPLLVRRQSD